MNWKAAPELPPPTRKEGFHNELANHPGIEILESQTGHFERAKGREVMESFLKTHGDKIKGVYAHNDDMMLGAIFFETAWKLKNGETVDRWIKSEEGIFLQEDLRKYIPPVCIIFISDPFKGVRS